MVVADRLHYRCQSAKLREAFTLVEMTVSIAILIVAFTLITQAIVRIATETKAADRRLVALAEAENLLERLASGIETIDPSSPHDLSKEATEFLPESRVEVEVTETNIDGVALNQLVVRIHYQSQSGRNARPVQLVTWVQSERLKSTSESEDDPAEGDVD